MKKKARRSKRNRHTGKINAFKAKILSEGSDFTMGNRMYSSMPGWPRTIVFRGARY